MKRNKIAAANWKMNTTIQEGEALLEKLLAHDLADDVDIVVCAPATHLFTLSAICADTEHVYIGAQNMSQYDSGAYTGELSGAMLLSAGVSHVIIGHSERREYFGETDELLGLKLKKAVHDGLIPIFCCGEQLSVRKQGNHVDHVINQLTISFEGMTAEELSDLIIAYEPIWAIGTGETATPEQAQEMHAAIRAFLSDRFSAHFAQMVPILYGGSVKPNNAADLFGRADVDGGLVGGASLDPEGFATIVNSFS